MIISVITPVYNRSDSIERCMSSVERAIRHLSENRGEYFHGIEIEHIVVDDGSKDETPQIVCQYAENHKWLRFVSFPMNRGTNAARNAAIEVAKGEWCVLLDSDDYFLPIALVCIVDTIMKNPGYKHYMFSPDDMQTKYEQNYILKGCREKALLYPDFLNGHIHGDFIHVCNTEILRRHPFDDSLRVYEGLFFLLFFREAQQMWFTNKIVTIRERNRDDSVTREMIRTKKVFIERTIHYDELLLANFEGDLKTLHMSRRLSEIKMNLVENLLLNSDYHKVKILLYNEEFYPCLKKYILICVYKLRLGNLFRLCLWIYLFLKYKIFCKKIA